MSISTQDFDAEFGDENDGDEVLETMTDDAPEEEEMIQDPKIDFAVQKNLFRDEPVAIENACAKLGICKLRASIDPGSTHSMISIAKIGYASKDKVSVQFKDGGSLNHSSLTGIMVNQAKVVNENTVVTSFRGILTSNITKSNQIRYIGNIKQVVLQFYKDTETFKVGSDTDEVLKSRMEKSILTKRMDHWIHVTVSTSNKERVVKLYAMIVKKHYATKVTERPPKYTPNHARFNELSLNYMLIPIESVFQTFFYELYMLICTNFVATFGKSPDMPREESVMKQIEEIAVSIPASHQEHSVKRYQEMLQNCTEAIHVSARATKTVFIELQKLNHSIHFPKIKCYPETYPSLISYNIPLNTNVILADFGGVSNDLTCGGLYQGRIEVYATSSTFQLTGEKFNEAIIQKIDLLKSESSIDPIVLSTVERSKISFCEQYKHLLDDTTISEKEKEKEMEELKVEEEIRLKHESGNPVDIKIVVNRAIMRSALTDSAKKDFRVALASAHADTATVVTDGPKKSNAKKNVGLYIINGWHGQNPFFMDFFFEMLADYRGMSIDEVKKIVITNNIARNVCDGLLDYHFMMEYQEKKRTQAIATPLPLDLIVSNSQAAGMFMTSEEMEAALKRQREEEERKKTKPSEQDDDEDNILDEQLISEPSASTDVISPGDMRTLLGEITDENTGGSASQLDSEVRQVIDRDIYVAWKSGDSDEACVSFIPAIMNGGGIGSYAVVTLDVDYMHSPELPKQDLAANSTDISLAFRTFESGKPIFKVFAKLSFDNETTPLFLHSGSSCDTLGLLALMKFYTTYGLKEKSESCIQCINAKTECNHARAKCYECTKKKLACQYKNEGASKSMNAGNFVYTKSMYDLGRKSIDHFVAYMNEDTFVDDKVAHLVRHAVINCQHSVVVKIEYTSTNMIQVTLGNIIGIVQSDELNVGEIYKDTIFMKEAMIGTKKSIYPYLNKVVQLDMYKSKERVHATELCPQPEAGQSVYVHLIEYDTSNNHDSAMGENESENDTPFLEIETVIEDVEVPDDDKFIIIEEDGTVEEQIIPKYNDDDTKSYDFKLGDVPVIIADSEKKQKNKRKATSPGRSVDSGPRTKVYRKQTAQKAPRTTKRKDRDDDAESTQPKKKKQRSSAAEKNKGGHQKVGGKTGPPTTNNRAGHQTVAKKTGRQVSSAAATTEESEKSDEEQNSSDESDGEKSSSSDGSDGDETTPPAMTTNNKGYPTVSNKSVIEKYPENEEIWKTLNDTRKGPALMQKANQIVDFYTSEKSDSGCINPNSACTRFVKMLQDFNKDLQNMADDQPEYKCRTILPISERILKLVEKGESLEEIIEKFDKTTGDIHRKLINSGPPLQFQTQAPASSTQGSGRTFKDVTTGNVSSNVSAKRTLREKGIAVNSTSTSNSDLQKRNQIAELEKKKIATKIAEKIVGDGKKKTTRKPKK